MTQFWTAGWGFSPAARNTDPAKGAVSVEVDDATWRMLVTGQSQGQLIVADASGQPELATPPATVTTAKTVFAPRDFIGLFTAQEQQAIFTAAQTNWEVMKFVALVTSGNVDVTNAAVVADVDDLVTLDLLTQARAGAILAGQGPGGAS